MNAITPLPGRHALAPCNAKLARMLGDVADAAIAPLAERDRIMAAVLAAHLHQPELLEGIACPCNPARYTRHLLHADPAGGYAVVAIAWRPGQMSPVHGHRTWCALGIVNGLLTETLFRLEAGAGEGEIVRPVTCIARRPGDVSHAPASRNAIHRLANLGTEEAVSIHVYGVSYDDFGDGVNHVWAA
jgi:predicted metal-dependent enzyme (double-stranded beta helix superfamily)